MSLLQSFIPALNRSTCSPEKAAAYETAGVRPVYEVKETAEAYLLTAFLPGVAKDGLEVTVDNELVSVKGTRSWKAPTDWAALYRESSHLPFVLALRHDQAVDAEKVSAELKDGVLRVSLPKAEAVKPRKIQVA